MYSERGFEEFVVEADGETPWAEAVNAARADKAADAKRTSAPCFCMNWNQSKQSEVQFQEYKDWPPITQQSAYSFPTKEKPRKLPRRCSVFRG